MYNWGVYSYCYGLGKNTLHGVGRGLVARGVYHIHAQQAIAFGLGFFDYFVQHGVWGCGKVYLYEDEMRLFLLRNE